MRLRNVEIVTSLSFEQAHTAIAAIVRPRLFPGAISWDALLNWKLEHPFHGVVHAESFDVRRVIRHGSLALPVIHGEVIAEATDTRVRLTMRPSIPTILFAAFTFAFSLICLVWELLTNPAVGRESILLMLAVPAVILTLQLVNFHLEACAAERLFRTALKQKAITPVARD